MLMVVNFNFVLSNLYFTQVLHPSKQSLAQNQRPFSSYFCFIQDHFLSAFEAQFFPPLLCLFYIHMGRGSFLVFRLQYHQLYTARKSSGFLCIFCRYISPILLHTFQQAILRPLPFILHHSFSAYFFVLQLFSHPRQIFHAAFTSCLDTILLVTDSRNILCYYIHILVIVILIIYMIFVKLPKRKFYATFSLNRLI